MSFATPIHVAVDYRGNPLYVTDVPLNVYTVTLGAGSSTALSIDVSDPIVLALFSFSNTANNVWVSADGNAAAAPAGATFAASNSQLNIAGFRLVKPYNGSYKNLNFYTDDADVSVSVSIFACQ